MGSTRLRRQLCPLFVQLWGLEGLWMMGDGEEDGGAGGWALGWRGYASDVVMLWWGVRMWGSRGGVRGVWRRGMRLAVRW